MPPAGDMVRRCLVAHAQYKERCDGTHDSQSHLASIGSDVDALQQRSFLDLWSALFRQSGLHGKGCDTSAGFTFVPAIHAAATLVESNRPPVAEFAPHQIHRRTRAL
ncbi:MAG: hypothetical protein JWN43_4077 [Gammaproteobacteria bacterium]|nr:hypothetical protein [Gammaproteobacteria bacterium]